MKHEQMPASGAMEGGGAYNKNAKLPAGGGAFALPHLEDAAPARRAGRRWGADRNRRLWVFAGEKFALAYARCNRSRAGASWLGPINICLSRRPTSKRLQCAFRGLGQRSAELCPECAERISLRDRTVILRKRASAETCPSWLVFLRRHVDEPDPDAGSRSLLRPTERGRRARGLRPARRARLEKILVVAGRGIAAERAIGDRSSDRQR